MEQKHEVLTQEELGSEITAIERQANAIVISDDVGYSYAGELCKQVKAQNSRVADFFEPLRLSTKKAYDDVLARKKMFTEPLTKAEKIIKSKMVDYVAEQERKRREAEEAMRAAARKAAEEKLAEAIDAEASGDTDMAEFATDEADYLDSRSRNLTVESTRQKAKGVTEVKSWKIVSIDAKKVPVEINGAVIRPVDEKAVMALIKASKGNIKIDGIEFEETVTLRVM